MSYSLINSENFHFSAFITLFCHSGSLCCSHHVECQNVRQSVGKISVSSSASHSSLYIVWGIKLVPKISILISIRFPENPLLRHARNIFRQNLSFQESRMEGGVEFPLKKLPHMMQRFVKTLDESGGKTIQVAYYFKCEESFKLLVNGSEDGSEGSSEGIDRQWSFHLILLSCTHLT